MRNILCSLCLLIFCSNTASAQELDRALVATNPVNYVNSLSPANKSIVAREVFDRVKASGDQFDTLINLMCEIQPWTTGDAQTDVSFQKLLWGRAAREQAPYTDLFAALDCAAANKKDFYFSEVVQPIADIRRAVCEGSSLAEFPATELDQIKSSIEKIDRQILRGLTFLDTNTRKTRSYFPLRNATRRASLEAAIAVRAAQSDWSKAQVHFLEGARILDEWTEIGRDGVSHILLRNTRNGWRFHNDLEFYSALYKWLGGETEELDISDLVTWPAVKDDAEIKGSLSPKLQRTMPNGFVDYIYVGRILPGAAPTEQECNRWRNRSYNTHEFAFHVQMCAQGVVPNGLASLQRFDDCVAEYEASDWRVQFLAFKSRSNWKSIADNEINKIRAALETSTINLDDVIESVSADKGRWVRIMTEEKFSTSRINEISAELRSIYPKVLIARPQLY